MTSDVLLNGLRVVILDLLEVQVFRVFAGEFIFQMLQLGLKKGQLILVGFREFRFDGLMKEAELARARQTCEFLQIG